MLKLFRCEAGLSLRRNLLEHFENLLLGLQWYLESRVWLMNPARLMLFLNRVSSRLRHHRMNYFFPQSRLANSGQPMPLPFGF